MVSFVPVNGCMVNPKSAARFRYETPLKKVLWRTSSKGELQTLQGRGIGQILGQLLLRAGGKARRSACALPRSEAAQFFM